MQTAETLVFAIEIYLYIGLAVAGLFLIVGIERVEPGARGAYAFRPLLIPGLCLLWPLVLHRWWILEMAKKDAS